MTGIAKATILDFHPMIDTQVKHIAEQKARSEKNRITNDYAARGLGVSGPFARAVVESYDAIHKEAVDSSMNLIAEFIKSGADTTIEAMIDVTRTRLELIEIFLVTSIPPIGEPRTEQLRKQYQAHFKQRTDIALKSIRVGFIGGRKVIETQVVKTAPEPSTVRFTDAFGAKFEFHGLSVDFKKLGQWVTQKTKALRPNLARIRTAPKPEAPKIEFQQPTVLSAPDAEPESHDRSAQS